MALKRIRMKNDKDGFPITAMREIKLLQRLKHKHIVELQQIMVAKGKNGAENNIYRYAYASLTVQAPSTWLWSIWITICRAS